MVEVFDNDYVKELMNKCLDSVLDNYNEEHRHYHNLTHIENMLLEISNLDFQLNQNELIVLYLATIFHDAVYDPQQPDRDNVLQSIKFFETTISDFKIVEQLQEINPQIIPLVRNLIGSTIGHNHNAYSIEIDVEGFNLHIDKLRSIFLDIDLSILAASEKYSEYAANIRKEYEHIPKVEYRDARVKILESFLQKAENNELFKVLTHKNKPAVANLTWELVKLSLTI